MGRDKALLEFRGATLVEAIAATVAQATGTATLVGNPESYDRFGYPAIPDRYPGEGPLGGILTALEHTSADWNLVTACDMPSMTSALLEELLDTAERLNSDALVPCGAAGRLEPLCAVYHRRARPLLDGQFAAGVRKVLQALEAVRAIPYPVLQVACFQNVNTPEEWSTLDR
jgi:molybdopterin-guanine dinucleotide biosynthesis protein A